MFSGENEVKVTAKNRYGKETVKTITVRVK
jgi:hypothetical protein